MLYYLLAGFLGMIFHTIAKMASLKKDYEVANMEFSVKKFIMNDWLSLSSSVLFIFIMALVLPEILLLRPELEDYLRLLFTMGGAIGSYVFSYFLSRSKKYLRGVIDSKTNIADGKENIKEDA